MKTRRRLALWATVAVAFVASTVPATAGASPTPPAPTPAPADSSGSTDQVVEESWALAPAGSLDPNEAGNRPELSYASDQGSVIEDAVTLYNFGTVQLTFKLYATDAYNGDAGEFALPPGDQTPTDVGTWVTLAQDLITIPPGTQATIPVTIRIPADAAPGDHVGAILASSPTLGTGDTGQILTLDRRTGTRLYVRVNGDLFPELAVTDVDTSYHHSLSPLGGSAHVTFRVENRGNIRLSGTPMITISGPFGIGERKVTLTDFPELLPGQDVTLSADIDDVVAGVMDSTTVRVVPHGAEDAGAVKGTSGDDVTFAPPISVLIALLVIVLAVLFRRYRRHHRSPAAAPTGAATRERELQPT